MGMERVVATLLQLAAQRAKKSSFTSDRYRRMNDAGTKRSRLFIECARPAYRAKKGPIEIDTFVLRVPQHANEPVLHGPPIQAFDDVDDLQGETA